MTVRPVRLEPKTRRAVAALFQRLDFSRLASIYCDEGGEAFWMDRREPCRRVGLSLARVLRGRLRPGGRSLYVGAGVAELPVLVMEVLELGRRVVPCTLRRAEANVLNDACEGLPLRVRHQDASAARGAFDHLWMVSVLNDPERFPQVSAVSYGRVDPLTFDPRAFVSERRRARQLASACLRKLSQPALVTTSVEEIPWIVEWCARRRVPVVVEEEDYPTAIVGDPVCLVRIGA